MSEIIEEGKKKCISCNNILSLDMFSKQRKKYHSSYCMQCVRDKNTERCKKNNEDRDLEFSNHEYGENNFKCECCKEIKPVFQFNKNNKTKFGIRRICTKCFTEKRNKLRIENKFDDNDYSDIEVNGNNDLTANQLAMITISQFNRIDKNHSGYLDAIKKIKDHVDSTINNIQ